MTSLVPRHVLVTQAHMQRLMGSEIATLELIKYFQSLGSKVTLLTCAIGEPVLSYLSDFSNLRLLQINIDDIDSALIEDFPDLAWIHHGLVPAVILDNPGKIKIIFNHMSAQIPIEYPYFPNVEVALSSLSLFNAEKIKLEQMSTGLYSGLNSDQIQLFANPAPDEFKVAHRAVSRNKKPAIAVVSNHIPEEIFEAMDKLSDKFEISLVGAQKDRGATPELVTPEFLAKFDAVISIGKTVQYSLLAGIPIYCYDHFGGPGWITVGNLEQAGFDNFSGRGFSQKTSPRIVEEIVNRDLNDSLEIELLREKATSIYSLSTRMQSILEFIENQTFKTWAFDNDFLVTYQYCQATLASYIQQWVKGLGEIELLSIRLSATQEALEWSHLRLDQIKRITGVKLWRRVTRKL